MEWKGWTSYEPEAENPYADWFLSRGGDQASNFGRVGVADPGLIAKSSEQIVGDRFNSGLRAILESKELYGGIVAPDFMLNSEFIKGSSWELPGVEHLPHPHPDTVVVGIIDTGIALGHRSTRRSDGSTRFLAAWQQSADLSILSDELRQRQGHLPFGRELFANDIDQLLDEHSIGERKDGWLDEEAFNRAAGLVDFRNTRGHRDLTLRAAHGIHVLDRAVGCDPRRDPEFADRVRMIAINLPNREIVGLSGSFLEQYVLLGIARIVEIADAFAKRAKQSKDTTHHPTHGDHYPVIINLSFGKQAGAPDRSGPIARMIEAINERKKVESDSSQEKIPIAESRYIDKGAVYITIPAGNDNLLKGNAVTKLQKLGDMKSRKNLPWRVLPEDRSSNYVEIWSDKLVAADIVDQKIPLRVSIELPNGVPWGASLDKSWQDLLNNLPIDDSQDIHRVFRNEIADIARVYCRLVKIKREHENHPDEYRIHYFICAAPTLVQDPGSPAAPAGLWNIELENMTRKELCVFVSIQTDQSAMPDGITGLRSYFEDETYKLLDETTGRFIDSYPYPDEHMPRILTEDKLQEYLGIGNDRAETVKRHGTMNAIGSDAPINYSIVPGGYRATDGAPAAYSATGTLGTSQPVVKSDPIGAALVTDDGPAHPGILSAGARDGSAVAMRGTSFAASQVTRIIVEQLVEGVTDMDPNKWIARQSYDDNGIIRKNEERLPPPSRERQRIGIGGLEWYRSRKTNPNKTGLGRFPQSHYRGLKRLGLEEE